MGMRTFKRAFSRLPRTTVVALLAFILGSTSAAYAGGPVSGGLPEVVANLNEEIAARVAAVSALQNALAAEVSARMRGDADTLAAAKVFTSATVAAEAAARHSGDADTLAAANGYTDAGLGAESSARGAGDAAALSNAKTYTDQQVAAFSGISGYEVVRLQTTAAQQSPIEHQEPVYGTRQVPIYETRQQPIYGTVCVHHNFVGQCDQYGPGVVGYQTITVLVGYRTETYILGYRTVVTGFNYESELMANAQCPSGKRMTNGMVSVSRSDASISTNRPSTATGLVPTDGDGFTGWLGAASVSAANATSPWTLTAFAICMNAP
ncbi:MAG: hypothetical protein AUH85_17480 [Chloroflexi bacterium 13_1_40CM_4_68_4]|nr:MAG: hypothetical protein AUH85_17480 [Chloroflexi bacterium 13_1_40CM_4_68_4]